MRDIQPRRFNKKVVLEKPVTIIDSTTNEAAPSYTPFCERWASIEPLAGRELMNAKAVEADSSHKITFYADSKTHQFTPRWRIRYDMPQAITGPGETTARYFHPLNINNVEERNRLFVVICKEQTQ